MAQELAKTEAITRSSCAIVRTRSLIPRSLSATFLRIVTSGLFFSTTPIPFGPQNHTSPGVDFTRRTVTVFKSKNGEWRTIPLNQTVVDLLSHKYEQGRGLRGIETRVVFCSEAGTELDGSNLRRGFTAALKGGWSALQERRHSCPMMPMLAVSS